MKDKNDLMRQLVELAVNCGRKRQSGQTGLVHHYHGAHEGEPHLAVPIVENLLFVLALFKSRTMENIAEAKEILDRLLHFQNGHIGEVGAGNFPLYLHDFPQCKDRFVSAHVSLPLYWILKLFHQVLGQALKERLEKALSLAVAHALRSMEEKTAPYPVALKIAAVAKAGGALLHDAALERTGEELLGQLQQHPDPAAWMCPAALGAMLTALAAVYPQLKGSPWNDLWIHLDDTWHRSTGCYIGPALKEWQLMAEPQPTLYDLFMGYLSGEFSSRALKDSLTHLEAALIPPFEDSLGEPAYPLLRKGTLGSATWVMHHDRSIAYSVLQREPACIKPSCEKGYHLLRVLWGNKQHVHSLVCPGGNYKGVSVVDVPGGFDMLFELGAPPVEDAEREQTREVAFFGDIHAGFNIAVAGAKATTFLLGDEIKFESPGLAASMTFSLEDGEGKFIGHRMYGNRPSQIGAKGVHRHEAFDWTVFLRTLQRSEQCAIKVSVRIDVRPGE